MNLSKILSGCIKADKIIPNFLGAEDAVWLERLIEEFMRFDGRPRRDLVSRLKEPFPFSAPPPKLALASIVLKQTLWNAKSCKQPIQPRLVRATLFKLAYSLRDQNKALIETAKIYCLSTEDLLALLFSDLPQERTLKTDPLLTLTPAKLALESNLLLVKALLARSRHLTLEIYGQCRPVVRQAKLRGLICVVEPSGSADGFRLSISGPFSLFRHTLVYGRYLGELVPLLQACDRFSLDSVCVIKDKERTLHLQSGVPIAPTDNINRFDSQLERRFARDFGKLTTEWDLIREPEPLVIGNRWLFPDFEVRHRRNPERRWCIELIGFWSPEYLRDKFEKLHAAKLKNFIICLDKKNACGQTESWKSLDAHVIEFSKRVNAEVILQYIQSHNCEPKSILKRATSAETSGMHGSPNI